MKLIQALKKIKDLQIKADDLKNKVSKFCADLNFETPMYADQKKQISEWIQAHSDITKEVLHLRIAIQTTNLQTNVTIELGGKQVVKTIAEWIHRRKDLAKQEMSIWAALTDKNLREGNAADSTGTVREVKIRRYFDPEQKDKMVELYRSEPSVIDSTLEVVNAVTDLIE